MTDDGPGSPPGNPPTVTVLGEAVVRVDPDEATLWLGVSALEPSPAAALGEVARRAEVIVGMLEDLGVAAADRSTAGVTVEEEWDHSSPEGKRSLGHRARASAPVRTADPELIGRIVTRLAREHGSDRS
jgi:uncharacterized protein YggE